MTPSLDLPLGRFLPPVPAGAVSLWLAENVPPGSWVLDPFGANPLVALEAARAGYRVLVAVNNPVARFQLEMFACAPPAADFSAALSDMASARKGDERLERHLQALYETACPRCERTIPAQAFLWERSAKRPYARLILCPYCAESGEFPLTPADLTRLTDLPPAGLHRARALERIAPIDDPLRPDVESALDAYLPRSLYTLVTLISKLDSPAIPAARKALLQAMLLTVCDEGNSLWPHPSGRARPRQLSVPPRFRENNLWLRFLEAAQPWQVNQVDPASDLPPVAVHVWPSLANPGEITLFAGRMKDLAAELAGIQIGALSMALPRPNAAFWTLSALWAGWLWGRETAAPLRPMLGRKRFDWDWHTSALQSVFENLSSSLPAGVPVFGLMGEAEPAFVTAALSAGARAGLQYTGLAYRAEPAQVQILWKTGLPPARKTTRSREGMARAALQQTLCDLGEPSVYLPAHCAVLSALAHASALDRPVQRAEKNSPDPLQAVLSSVFTGSGALLRYGAGEGLETGSWWLSSPRGCGTALADRVEMEVQRSLQKGDGLSLEEIDAGLTHAFPGLLTPAPTLVQVCLTSYGQSDDGLWRLRPEDQPAARRAELKIIAELAAKIGRDLGYRVTGAQPILWFDAGGTDEPAALAVYITASALIGKYVFQPGQPPARTRLILLPGGRSNLLAYKLEKNPRLSQAVAEGWRLLKFRHLRELAEIPELDRETWAEQVHSDPLEYRAEKLQF